MGNFDAKFKGKAEAFLAKNGRPVTVNYVTPGNYNASTGEGATGTQVDTVTIASPLLRYSDQYIDGTTIQSGDATIIFAPEDLTAPLVDHRDTITVDGEAWEIITDLTVSSGELDAMHKYHIRKKS
ncbi:MAG: hypothetical protein JRD89_12305 [Deltaproteobacteria bacterium]|nr:hypothetical protein [Deltaproteobacteria bacterium]